jgi:hypothetical protein
MTSTIDFFRNAAFALRCHHAQQRDEGQIVVDLKVFTPFVSRSLYSVSS